MKVVVLSAAELTVWLRRNAALISQLAQSERLMASQPTVAFGRDFICQFLERDALSFDEGDLDSQRTISAAARDLVVGPLANRRL